MQDSQRFAAQSQDSQRRARTRSAEPGLAAQSQDSQRFAAQSQDSQRRGKTRGAYAGLTCRGAARAKLASQTLALRRQESRRRAWTRCAKHGLSAQTQRRATTRSSAESSASNQRIRPRVAIAFRRGLDFEISKLVSSGIHRPLTWERSARQHSAGRFRSSVNASCPESKARVSTPAFSDRAEAYEALMEGSTERTCSLTWPARGLAPRPRNRPLCELSVWQTTGG